MRRRLLASVGGKPLPYKRRLAYIEGTGEQYLSVPFETGALDGLKFQASFAYTESYAYMTDHIIFHFGDNGFVNYSTGFGVGWSGTLFWTILNKTYNTKYTSRFPVGTRLDVDVDYDANKFSINNILDIDMRHGGWGGLDFSSRILFLRNNYGFTKAKIWSFKCDYNGRSISLVPVMSLDDEPCMYDEVSGQFFYNQGTGEFTCGELET